LENISNKAFAVIYLADVKFQNLETPEYGFPQSVQSELIAQETLVLLLKALALTQMGMDTVADFWRHLVTVSREHRPVVPETINNGK